MEKQYVDDGFPTEFPVIAPFLVDLDTSGGRGAIFYRQTETPGVLNRIATEVQRGFPGSKFTPTHAVITTWENVGAYEEVTRHTQSPQPVRTGHQGGGWVARLILYKGVYISISYINCYKSPSAFLGWVARLAL